MSTPDITVYTGGMGRWEPGARDRLARAALELYGEQGFAQTTVAEIAERAGLTERTFFRHFADKREVLFSGSEELQERIAAALGDADSALSPIDAVAVALYSLGPMFETRRPFAKRRQSIITGNIELAERERNKMAGLATILLEGLRRRGTGNAAASLAAEMGITVFRLSFERWIESDDERTLEQTMHEYFDELKLVSAGKSA
jgi:AcrR family transcriptional regulator